MTKRDSAAGSLATVGIAVAAMAVAAALRLPGVSTDLILDDEWHGLHVAATRSAREILGLLTVGATSIPLNLYYRALLKTIGWSELSLRMPSLVAGIALPAVLPFAVRGLVRMRAALLASLLLAVSPPLIYYSRFARPYSPVVLLTFLAILAAYRWASSGKTRHLTVFLSFGIAAAYLHVLEIRNLALPLAFFLLWQIAGRIWKDRAAGRALAVGPRSLLIAGAVAAAGTLLLYLPVLTQGAQRFTVLIGRDSPRLSTFWGALQMMFGTARPVPVIALSLLSLLGLVLFCVRSRLLGGLLLFVAAGNVAAVLATAPTDSHLAIVTARYLLPLAPFLALAAGVGLDGLLRPFDRSLHFSPWVRRSLGLAIVVAVPAATFFAGPLPNLLRGTNNFRAHKCFQSDYSRPAPGETRFSRYRVSTGASRRPVDPSRIAFYRRLAREESVSSIIEYPVPFGDASCPYPDYQAIHRKRVVGGYVPQPPRDATLLREGFVQVNWTPGVVLQEVADRAKLHFRSYVDLTDPRAVEATGARYLVFHDNTNAELSGTAGPPSRKRPAAPDWARQFGDPVYTDPWVVVFDLGR